MALDAKLAVLFQVFKGRPSASDQKAAIGVPTAGEGQGYRVIVSQRVVGIKPSPTHPTPAFWRMGPSRLVPEERKPKKGAIRWGALSSPLVETGR